MPEPQQIVINPEFVFRVSPDGGSALIVAASLHGQAVAAVNGLVTHTDVGGLDDPGHVALRAALGGLRSRQHVGP